MAQDHFNPYVIKTGLKSYALFAKRFKEPEGLFVFGMSSFSHHMVFSAEFIEAAQVHRERSATLAIEDIISPVLKDGLQKIADRQ